MILIIDSKRKSAEALCDMFRYMGILAKDVHPKDAFGEISAIYRAVIISSPDALSDPFDYVSRLRRITINTPIYAICPNDHPASDLFDLTFKPTSYASSIKDAIIEYAYDNDYPIPGLYAIAGVNLSESLSTPTYFDTALPFTRTECMIIRYLIRTYPNPTSAQKILKHAYKASKQPDVSNIRTHISVINKKFRTVAGRSLIEMHENLGYRILTPELMATAK